MSRRAWIVLGTIAVGSWLAYLAVDPPPPGRGGVTGAFLAVDDTGLPDSRIGHARLLVVPGATITQVWPNLGPDVDMTGVIQRFDPEDLAERFGAQLITTASNGRFRITTGPGPTVMCQVFTGEWSETTGCSDLDLPERGKMVAAWGEVGFVAYVE